MGENKKKNEKRSIEKRKVKRNGLQYWKPPEGQLAEFRDGKVSTDKTVTAKLYFAKYLPVEGEIKEGDWFWSTPEVQGKKLWQNTSAISVTSNILSGYHLQKIKLFLCSRDIQIGDKYLEHTQVRPDRYSEFTADDETFFYEPNRIENAFKVAGPVSEGALTFVKEGDEFDKDEIKIFKYADSYDSKLITEMLGDKWEHGKHHIITPGKVAFVKIKGADGKFY